MATFQNQLSVIKFLCLIFKDHHLFLKKKKASQIEYLISCQVWSRLADRLCLPLRKEKKTAKVTTKQPADDARSEGVTSS